MADATALGRTARWLLVFCTLFGLAAMHTLGHAGVRPEHHVHVHAAAAAAMPEAVVAGCADCDGHGRHEMGGWSVCVAVLGGIALALLAGLLLLARARELPGLFRAAAAGCRPSRAPPSRRAGLRVASLAVLRV